MLEVPLGLLLLAGLLALTVAAHSVAASKTVPTEAEIVVLSLASIAFPVVLNGLYIDLFVRLSCEVTNQIVQSGDRNAGQAKLRADFLCGGVCAAAALLAMK